MKEIRLSAIVAITFCLVTQVLADPAFKCVNKFNSELSLMTFQEYLEAGSTYICEVYELMCLERREPGSENFDLNHRSIEFSRGC